MRNIKLIEHTLNFGGAINGTALYNEHGEYVIEVSLQEIKHFDLVETNGAPWNSSHPVLTKPTLTQRKTPKNSLEFVNIVEARYYSGLLKGKIDFTQHQNFIVFENEELLALGKRFLKI